MSRAKLKPCPFCGAQPAYAPENPERDGDAWSEIKCTNHDCEVEVGVRVYADSGHKDQAIEAWNRRAALEGDAQPVAYQQREKRVGEEIWSDWYPSSKDAFDAFHESGSPPGKFIYEVRALVATPPSPKLGVAVEALRRTRASLQTELERGVITDTLWMNDVPSETIFDALDAALSQLEKPGE